MTDPQLNKLRRWILRCADKSCQGPDELFETVSQALLNAVDRDALSGWGAHVYIIEQDKVTKRLLKGRQD